MTNFYLSKNYIETTSAGNKAKTDVEKILSDLGYKHAGLRQTTYSNKIIGFILTFTGIIKIFFTIGKNDTAFIQYPLKKYYTFACKLIHLRRGKVITLVHDLGAFRRKKISIKEEIRKLNHSDYLIVHNNNMKEWLTRQGYSHPMVCFEIWDYLSTADNKEQKKLDEQPIKVIYAGNSNYRKNNFLYSLEDIILNWKFELYGKGFDVNKIKNNFKFAYKGYCQSDKLIEEVCGHFGLIWDGDSVTGCEGNFGVYLEMNNPHKASLYIRCNLPIIIWKKAALAPFIIENKIGISIQSLEELNKILPSISFEEYNEMRKNIIEINKKISSGFYLKKALSQIDILNFPHPCPVHSDL